METLYPKAQWRPLSNIQSEPNIGIPRLLIVHTMVGYLLPTERMFRKNGYTGTESTFGLGGSWDGSSYDGTLFQWQSLTREADAQAGGNPYATSIECSDGGDSSREFSDKQLTALINLHVWWSKQTGRPARRANAWDGIGYGYHRMFRQWNPDSHTCPGNARARQLEAEVWPEAAHLLSAGVSNATPPAAQGWPRFPLREGDYYALKHNAGMGISEPGLRTWQRQMHNRGWTIVADGKFGPQTDRVCRLFQQEKGLGVDGRIGLHTWNCAWTCPVT